MTPRMLIDVEDPVRNLVLNGCFYSIALLSVVAVIPWLGIGAERISRLLRWLVFPVLGLGVVYESAMPSRFNIRLDLFLLLPCYGVVLLTSIVRWLHWRRIESPAKRAAQEDVS